MNLSNTALSLGDLAEDIDSGDDISLESKQMQGDRIDLNQVSQRHLFSSLKCCYSFFGTIGLRSNSRSFNLGLIEVRVMFSNSVINLMAGNILSV